MLLHSDVFNRCALSRYAISSLKTVRHVAIVLVTVALPIVANAQAPCEAGFEATKSENSSAMQLLTECLSNFTTPAPVRGKAFEYRAWLHYQGGNFKEAALDQERSFSFVPRLSYRSLINHSLYLRRALRLEDSLVFAKLAQSVESAAGDATSMKTQYHLGWSLFELGRYEEAVVAFTLGIPYQPDYSAVYWLRAQAYEKMGDNARAKTDLVTLSVLLQTPRGREDIGDWREAASEKIRAFGVLPP